MTKLMIFQGKNLNTNLFAIVLNFANFFKHLTRIINL